MAENVMSYREVAQNYSSPLRWKEITISIGGTPSSLQDQKLPEAAGGYAYRDSGRSGSPARNRYIYWRVQKDIVEFVEESLDFNLTNNCVRFRFQDTPVLNGVSIHEAHGHIIILLATVASVHRLVFPHPIKLHKYDQAYLQSTEHSVPSIFSDASVSSTQDSHCINLVGTPTYTIHSSAAWLTNDSEALFALATNVGSILLIKMPSYGIQGMVMQYELRQTGVMQRLWTGLVSAVVRSGAESQISHSLTIHPLGQDTLVFAVCQDHKLRVWSCKNQECVMAADLLEYVPGNLDAKRVTLGGEGHIIKKSVGSSSQSLLLAVFLSFSDRCQFCVFQPILSDGRYKLNHVTTVFCPDDELIDFTLTASHLWTLWTSAEGETFSKVTPFVSKLAVNRNWQCVFMDPPERGDLDVPPHKDPRDAYVTDIFQPGRFSNQALLRALHIYRRSLDPSHGIENYVPVEVLKAEVTAAVEHEIRNAASGYEMNAEEYYQLQLQNWAKFYSYCIQYHEVANKPMGIFADSNTGIISIVKKMCTSVVRPCHLVEHLQLSPSGVCCMEDLEGTNEEVCHDVLELCECLKIVASILTPDMTYAFQQDMYHTQSPEGVAHQMINNLLADTNAMGDSLPWQQEIDIQVQSVHDIVQATDMLLQLLDLARAWPDGMFVDDIALEASRQLSCSHLFASSSSIGLLTRSVAQMAETGFEMSRDLLLLLTLLSRSGQQANLQLQTAEQIQSELITRTATMVQAYLVLHWSTQTVATHATIAQQEQNQRELETLDLTDATAMPVMHKLAGQTVTILEAFLHGQGGNQTRAILAQSSFFDEDPCALWDQVLLPTITVVAQLLWPLSPNFLFPEFLACQCQYLQLQEYVRLTRDWCEANASSTKFLLGMSYLNTNEAQKAGDCFMEAVPSMTNEEFIIRLLLPQEDSMHHLEVLYYLKVIRLFEQFALPHLVVTLATTAISVAADDDPNKPTLWSKVFKHQLELGHNEQAYTAMISNPDPTRRKDCLRQLLVVLCERGELQQLVEFPYVDLQDDVVTILEARARSVDLSKHNYYDLLYAFHVFRANYRKAGTVMYEYGKRLGVEVTGLKGIQRQAKCYLAALNALRLVDPKYAWIVQPAENHEGENMDMELNGNSPKHMLDGEEIAPCQKKIDVLELLDIQKEYLLVDARLRLLQKDPEPSHMVGPTSSPAETVTLLVNAGLFDVATTICQLYKIPLTPVFEGLASRCVNLAQHSGDFMLGDNQYTAQAWSWLEDNNLDTINTKEVSAADQGWKLLHSYLEKYEDKSTLYHKCVAVKFLSQGFHLPTWFINSYKLVNAPELLRLYLDYDLLQEAAHFAMEYIDSVLGRGAEYFSIKTPLRYGAPAAWLPYTCIDQLLSALQDVDSDMSYQKLYSQLQEKMEQYFTVVDQVTHDTVRTSKFPSSPSWGSGLNRHAISYS